MQPLPCAQRCADHRELVPRHPLRWRWRGLCSRRTRSGAAHACAAASRPAPTPPSSAPPTPSIPSSRNPMPCSPSLRRTALLALSALLCGLAVPATPALAQEVYPSRPVTIVVVQSVDSTHEAVEKRLGMELDRWGRYEALYEYVDTM